MALSVERQMPPATLKTEPDAAPGRSQQYAEDQSDADSDRGAEKKPRKTRLTQEQLEVLQAYFKQNDRLDAATKQFLSQKLKMPPRQIEVWFQNCRVRVKKKKTEERCNQLKNENQKLIDVQRILEEENKRLAHENAQLKQYIRALLVTTAGQLAPNSLNANLVAANLLQMNAGGEGVGSGLGTGTGMLSPLEEGSPESASPECSLNAQTPAANSTPQLAPGSSKASPPHAALESPADHDASPSVFHVSPLLAGLPEPSSAFPDPLTSFSTPSPPPSSSSMAIQTHPSSDAKESSVLKIFQHALETFSKRAYTLSDLMKIMEDMCVIVHRAMGTEYVKILELLQGGEALLLRAGVGWRDGLVGSALVGTSTQSQSGYCLATGTPVIVENFHTENRFNWPTLHQGHGVFSGVSVVIGSKCQPRPYGVLGLHSSQRRMFTQNEVSFLSSMATILGDAIDRFNVPHMLISGAKLSSSFSSPQLALPDITLSTPSLEEIAEDFEGESASNDANAISDMQISLPTALEEQPYSLGNDDLSSTDILNEILGQSAAGHDWARQQAADLASSISHLAS